MARLRVAMSLIRLILLRWSACAAFSLARSIRAFFSPRAATRIVTAPPRRSLSHRSSSSWRVGSIGTITSRGTGAIGARKSSRPVWSCRWLRRRVACARDCASTAVTDCVTPIASRMVDSTIGASDVAWCTAPSPALSRASSSPSDEGAPDADRDISASVSLRMSAYTWVIISAIRSPSLMSSTRSTLQLRSPRIAPARTKNAWTEASSSSEAKPNTSASTS